MSPAVVARRGRRPAPLARRLRPVVAVVVLAALSGAAAQGQASAAPSPAPSAAPSAGPDPVPQAATYTTSGNASVATDDGRVLVRYPISEGSIAADRPLVLVGHGMGMDPALALAGHQYLVDAGYMVAVPPLGASTDYHGLARIVSRSLDAVLADRTLARGILPGRIGYTGGSQGGITGIAMQDPAVRDPRIKAFVVRSARVAGARPSWADAPPMLFALGTADDVISPTHSRAAYDAATHPKGKIELPGAGHDMVMPTRTAIVSEATKAFFARFLGGAGNGLDGIQAAVDKDPNEPSYVHDWALDGIGGDGGSTGAGSSATYHYHERGRLETGSRRRTHELVVTDSRLRADLAFAVTRTRPARERAVMTLRDADGDVVERKRGAGVLRLRADVADGSYRLTVRTPMRLRTRTLTYALTVAPRAIAGAASPSP